MTQTYSGVYSRQIENDNPNFWNVKTLNFLLMACIIAASLYYVSGINDLVVKGFKLQSLKVQASLLSEDNRKLSVETASIKSYNSLANRVASMGMVAVDNIEYVKADSGVAMAR